MEIFPLEPEAAGIQAEGLPHLQERYLLLIEALQEEHPGKILDESKSFLESIFRTISIDVYGETERANIERLRMPELCQKACDCTTLSADTSANTSLVEMAHALVLKIAQLRNSHGASAHGRDGYTVNEVGVTEAVFIAQSAVSLGRLFFTQHKGRSDGRKNQRVQYLDNPEFNAYLDEQEDVVVSGISLIPSEALFNTDPKGYRDKLNEYIDQKETEQHD